MFNRSFISQIRKFHAKTNYYLRKILPKNHIDNLEFTFQTSNEVHHQDKDPTYNVKTIVI